MLCKSGQSSLLKGVFFAMLSGVCFSVASVLVKMMRNLHPSQVALFKFIGTFLLNLPTTVKIGQNPFGPPEFRFLLIIRGVSGAIGLFLSFIAFQYLSLGEASVIVLSSPVVVSVFARIFLKEPLNIFLSTSVVLTIAGIIFTTKLPTRLTQIPITYSSEKIYGLVAAVFSLFCTSGLHLITRKIRNVHQSTMTFNFCWVGIFGTALLTAILGNFRWHYCGIQSLYILLLPIFSYGAITFAVMALQCEYAGPVVTVRAGADISLAFMWQIFIFDDVPDLYGILGAVLVLVSIVCISLHKCLRSLQGNLFPSKRFKFILS